MGIDTRGKRRLLAGSKLSIYLMSRSPSVRHCLFYHNRTLHTYNEEKITLFFMSHNAENMLFHFVHLYSLLMFWHYSLRSGARSPPEPKVIGRCTLSTWFSLSPMLQVQSLQNAVEIHITIHQLFVMRTRVAEVGGTQEGRSPKVLSWVTCF